MSTSFDRLVEIMDRLRDPGGCPWDREQTLDTLAPYFLEEAYEVVDAIAAGDPDKLCEELGDLLAADCLRGADCTRGRKLGLTSMPCAR